MTNKNETSKLKQQLPQEIIDKMQEYSLDIVSFLEQNPPSKDLAQCELITLSCIGTIYASLLSQSFGPSEVPSILRGAAQDIEDSLKKQNH